MGQEAEDVPVIYLHEIKRQYMQGEVPLTILNNAKLALWAGQSVALVAPSGSGKSTLLHIAGLLESPDEGEVYVAGAPTSQLSDAERTQIRRTEIGFVYQSHRLLPRAIVDKRNPSEVMRGYPVARATTPTGDWVYTLYSKNPGSSLTFVHALNAAGRTAFCIDLPNWSGGEDVWEARLQLSGDTLLVKAKGGATVARIDTRTLKVAV